VLVEQLARIAGQRQLSLQRGDPLASGRQFNGLNARNALDDSGVDEGLTFPAEQRRLQTPVPAAKTATASPDRSRTTICRRTDDE